ncbi:MAG: hypothetical protein Q5546_02280 [Haemophilus parahaemolyticus]|uniref:hypothetical protein n=1 Tax=Haemophilus parahaemolyticus TaxID=735 RepID=UPI001CECEFA0|nr:hypothetical protein [Haemophilus parahaemolyticus]MDQ6575778.1 hypothetical protein [Haemophilus parahaemolyticus]
MNSRRDFLKLLSLFSFAGSAPLLQAQELKRTNQPEQPVRIGYLLCLSLTLKNCLRNKASKLKNL